MLNPGMSDAEGNTALRHALLALGRKAEESDVGFSSKQYFVKGVLTPEQVQLVTTAARNPAFGGFQELPDKLVAYTRAQFLDAVSAFLANPDSNQRLIIPRKDYEKGRKVPVPIVMLPPKAVIEKFDLLAFTDQQLLELNETCKLAGNLDELHQFRDQFKDPAYLAQRKKRGLDHRCTDVELRTWFGLRSEHCFHKEFNARITIDDKVNDPIFERAFRKGWLAKDKDGSYVLDRGMFKTFVQEPAQAIFDRLEKRGKNWILSMFEDNSGVVAYDENYMFCIKFETHNSPSNKEPVQGAKTGIDGVNRDTMGTGLGTFDCIANFFQYLTGNPNYKGWLPKGVKHPYVLLKGVTQGVREGGNESQIPTVGGGANTDPRAIAKIEVHCGTVGWSPRTSKDGKDLLHKHAKTGDLVFIVGQPVGVDGIGGATESSLAATANISLGHVQADFSFIQAQAKGYILEVARDGLLSSITDMGAMGLGSASHETARETGGLALDLSLHPVKYKGIQPWQVNCSETQDRMLLVARPENEVELMRRARRHGVQITRLGHLKDDGFIDLNWGDEAVACVDIGRLFDKEPRKRMHATWDHVKETEEVSKVSRTLEQSLCTVMSQPDVASKEWFFRQKDSAVKGATIQGPLIGVQQEVEADATIQKPLDTEGKDFGAIAYALGIAPKQSDLDPYYSAQNSLVDMVGKIIAVGGALPDMDNAKWDAWAVCGNYCQPNSDSTTTLDPASGEHNLASLVREGIGVREAIEELNIPIISGKDSMKCSCVYDVDESFKLEDVPLDLRRHIKVVEKNGKEPGTRKRSIEIHDPDSYLASCAVKIDDYRKCVDSAFKEEDDLIYVVGTTKRHMGASQYNSAAGYAEQGAPLTGGDVPKVDFDEFKRSAAAIHRAIDTETVASCSYIHAGGLLTALAKAAMAGQKGAEIDMLSINVDDTVKNDNDILYSETPGRFIVTVAPQDQLEFEDAMAGSTYRRIGAVRCRDLDIRTYDDTHNTIIKLQAVKKAYQAPLRFGTKEGS
jgi:phosphoribosylformylglycinamidine synthase